MDVVAIARSAATPSPALSHASGLSHTDDPRHRLAADTRAPSRRGWNKPPDHKLALTGSLLRAKARLRGAASSGNECDVRPSHPQELFDAPVSAEQLSRLFEPHRPVPSERASWAIGVSIQVDRPSIVEEQSVRRSDRDMAGRKKMALPAWRAREPLTRRIRQQGVQDCPLVSLA